MTKQEADEIYRSLVDFLREERLDWVVAEVEEVVRAGRTVETEIPLETVPESGAGSRRRQIVRGHTQRDWTAEEQLALLLEAVDAAVCGPFIMESEIISLLPELAGHEIVFAPGGYTGEFPDNPDVEDVKWQAATRLGDPLSRPYGPYAVRLTHRTDEQRARARRLAELIRTVRGELNVDFG